MSDGIKAKLLGLRTMMLDERCTLGERENAKSLYERLLKKHHLTDDDIKNQELNIFWISYKNDYERELLHQIVGKLLNEHQITYYKSRSRKRDGFELTNEQYESIKRLYQVFKPALMKELEYCYDAFIQKNRLGIERDSSSDAADEDIEQILQIMKYMDIIKPTTVIETKQHRLIGSGK